MNGGLIAKMIADKGLDKVDLGMFSEEEKKKIYCEAAETLLRINKKEEALILLEKAGKLPIGELKKLAESKLQFGEYQSAYNLLIKTNQKAMAEFVRANFL